MIKDDLVDKYLNLIVSNNTTEGSRNNLMYYLDSLFEGVDFEGKRLLDIGGGYGKYSFYAACCGASEVVCIEPESAGSTAGTAAMFDSIKSVLGVNNIIFKTLTIQEFQPPEKKFDIFLLHNSINHFDETACMLLPYHLESRENYLRIFQKIAKMSSYRAVIIVCDCSCQNIYALLKIPNPFDPSIEWHKHQSPKVWIDLLSQVGFVESDLKWNYYSRYLPKGKPLVFSALVAYLFSSHFHFKMIYRPT